MAEPTKFSVYEQDRIDKIEESLKTWFESNASDLPEHICSTCGNVSVNGHGDQCGFHGCEGFLAYCFGCSTLYNRHNLSDHNCICKCGQQHHVSRDFKGCENVVQHCWNSGSICARGILQFVKNYKPTTSTPTPTPTTPAKSMESTQELLRQIAELQKKLKLSEIKNAKLERDLKSANETIQDLQAGLQ